MHCSSPSYEARLEGGPDKYQPPRLGVGPFVVAQLLAIEKACSLSRFSAITTVINREENAVTEAIGRRPSSLLALGGVLVALLLAVGLGSAVSAEASTSPYCNNQTLGSVGTPAGWCTGASRNLYAVYGWGDNHSVCVGFSVSPEATSMMKKMCSGGPGSGVYNPWGSTFGLYPVIANNAAGSNLVHGVAYQP